MLALAPPARPPAPARLSPPPRARPSLVLPRSRSLVPRARPDDPRASDAPSSETPSAPTSRASPRASPPRAVVVGAGPAGALSALYLANLGWRVRVFERRARPERSSPAANPPARDGEGEGEGEGDGEGTSRPIAADSAADVLSYNVVLSPRGLAALDAAGVALPDDAAVRLRGNARHARDGTLAVSDQFRGAVAIHRGVLAATIAAAAAAKPDAVEFHYSRTLEGVDFERKVATFAPAHSEPYDLLVAADGVRSEIRGMLERRGEIEVAQRADEMRFKTVSLPAIAGSPDETTSPNERASPNALAECFHVWPRGLVSMLAPPDANGETLSGVIILPGGRHARATTKKKKKKKTPSSDESEEGGFVPRTWDDVKDAADVGALFAEYFPDAFGPGAAVPARASEQLLAQTSRPGGITTVCSSLVSESARVVLVGDAAHSAWPSLGQGANCALETARYLGVAMEGVYTSAGTASERSSGSGSGSGSKEGSSRSDERIREGIGVALRRFDEVRLEQVRACGRLSEAGFGGTARRASNWAFVARLALSAILHKLAPFAFDRPALFRINDPEWAYDEIEDAVQRETQALAAFGALALVCAAGAWWRGWGGFVELFVGGVRAIALGEGSASEEGAALVALGAVAIVTGALRAIAKRRRGEGGGGVKAGGAGA